MTTTSMVLVACRAFAKSQPPRSAAAASKADSWPGKWSKGAMGGSYLRRSQGYALASEGWEVVNVQISSKRLLKDTTRVSKVVLVVVQKQAIRSTSRFRSKTFLFDFCSMCI